MNINDFRKTFSAVMEDVERKSGQELLDELAAFEGTEMGDIFGLPASKFDTTTLHVPYVSVSDIGVWRFSANYVEDVCVHGEATNDDDYLKAA